MTKNTLIIATIVCFLLAPLTGVGYSPPNGQNVPPVEQALVREGDFALKLAQALGLGTQVDEVEAMGALAAAGVAPVSRWIADYPVTPDILGELEAAVADAAKAGRLAASEEEALFVFQEVAAGFGLAVAAAPQKGDLQEEPPRTYPSYADPAVIHHHYYNMGPPVVTYYPPPRDYFYLYAWVPYPFYWHSFRFPGFFILHDFNRVVFVRHRTVKVVTNHVFVPRTRKVVIVDHRRRTRGKVFEDRQRFSDRRRFDSIEARRGARSIVERSRSRERFRDSSRAVESRGPSGRPSGVQRPESRRKGTAFTSRGPGAGTSRSGRTESFNRPSTGRPLESRSEAFSGNRGVRSFNRPDVSTGQSGRNYNRPSTSGSGRNRFDAITGNQSRSPQSFRGSSGSSSIRRDPSSRMGRSFQSPSRARSGRGGPVLEMRGGGSRGRGDFTRGGSRGSECRGRC